MFSSTLDLILKAFIEALSYLRFSTRGRIIIKTRLVVFYLKCKQVLCLQVKSLIKIDKDKYCLAPVPEALLRH